MMKCTVVKDLLTICNTGKVIDAIMHMENAEGHRDDVYEIYSTLMDELKLRIPNKTDSILLGCKFKRDGVESIETSLYKLSDLKNFSIIPAYETIDNIGNLSDAEVQTLICKAELPYSYAFELEAWNNILGFKLDEINVEECGRHNILASILYEMTFFGLSEECIKEERTKLDDCIEEVNQIRQLPENERNKHFKPWDSIKGSMDFGKMPESEYNSLCREVLYNNLQSYNLLKMSQRRAKNTNYDKVTAIGYFRFTDKASATVDEYHRQCDILKKAIADKGYDYSCVYFDIGNGYERYPAEATYILDHFHCYDYDVLFVDGLDHISLDKEILYKFCKAMIVHNRRIYDIKSGEDVKLESIHKE